MDGKSGAGSNKDESETYKLDKNNEFGIFACRGVNPESKDEPVTALRLYGRNLASVAHVHGWSHAYSEYFPSLPNEKVIRQFDPKVLTTDEDMDDGRYYESAGLVGGNYGREPSEEDKVKRLYSERATLSQILIGREIEYSPLIKFPLLLTVLAKHRLELAVVKDGVLIFGKLIAADETGVCIVKFINNTNQTAYNVINVGDQILILSFTPIKFLEERDILPHFSVAPPFILSGCIKISDFNKLYLIKKDDGINSISSFFLPDRKKLWAPNSIQNLTDKTELIDMIGVVSHVSRFERCRKFESNMLSEDGETVIENFARFEITCWIEIVDKLVAKPIPILVYLSSLIWRKREELVPGSLIVITSVRCPLHGVIRIQEEYLSQSFHSTAFSEIYVNSDVEKYWMLMKSDSVNDEIQDFLGNENSSVILKRKDVPWSIGGAYPLPIANPQNFLEMYNAKVGAVRHSQFLVSPPLPLYRRESKLLIFKAVILRYDLCNTNVLRGSHEPWTWTNKTAFERHQIQRRSIEKVFDPYPANTSSPFLWFFWRRRFPDFQIEPSENTSNFHHKIKAYEAAENDFKHHTKAISMPVGNGEELKSLKVRDGAPHFAVDIWNLEAIDPYLKRFIFTWKPSPTDGINQIEDKLLMMRLCDPVLVVAKIHRVESLGIEENLGYDFMIHDIIPFAT